MLVILAAGDLGYRVIPHVGNNPGQASVLYSRVRSLHYPSGAIEHQKSYITSTHHKNVSPYKTFDGRIFAEDSNNGRYRSTRITGNSTTQPYAGSLISALSAPVRDYRIQAETAREVQISTLLARELRMDSNRVKLTACKRN